MKHGVDPQNLNPALDPEYFKKLWDRLRQIWDRLDLRILVLLSLASQITLVALGGRRNKSRRYWIKFMVWWAYLLTEMIAIYALGIVQDEPEGPQPMDMVENGRIVFPLRDIQTETKMTLRVFWTPFLLMYLGGPDTITAYALEDNELWFRQLFALLGQTVATLYILSLSWDGTVLSWLYVVVLSCGIIKCGERVWVFWSASTEQFRDSIPERQRKISKEPEMQKITEAEGHRVIELPEVLGHDVGVTGQAKATELSHVELYERSQREILIARELIGIYLPAFTDQPLSLDDESDLGRSKLKGKNHQSVFNIIAIELGYIYDLLFTKAMLFRTRWGFANRVTTLSLTIIIFGVFTCSLWKNEYKYDGDANYYRYDYGPYNYYGYYQSYYYGTWDLIITFVLVVAAVLLELYAIFFHHLLSDKFICWLIKHKHESILSIINRLQPLHNRERWSNKIGQFNLVSYSLKEKHCLFGHKLPEIIQKYLYHGDVNVSNVLKDRLYKHIKTIPDNNMYKDLQSLWAEKWKDTQRNEKLKGLKRFIKLENFDRCVLTWHIATEIYFHDFLSNSTNQDDDTREDAQVSLDLSRYMLYLMVKYPSMLPAGIGRFKFDDMHKVLTPFLKAYKSTTTEKLSVTDACNLLLTQVDTQDDSQQSSSDKNNSVRENGCKLAKQLREITDAGFRFEVLRETWIGMLTLAASKCDASYHLQQLRRGGELLTHVWLLLVHFGFTDHFQVPDAVEIAKPVGQEEEYDLLDEGVNIG